MARKGSNLKNLNIKDEYDTQELLDYDFDLLEKFENRKSANTNIKHENPKINDPIEFPEDKKRKEPQKEKIKRNYEEGENVSEKAEKEEGEEVVPSKIKTEKEKSRREKDEPVSAQKEKNFESKREWKPSKYRSMDESEFRVHFYINNVYLARNITINEFLDNVRERINKAGRTDLIQIVYGNNNNEVRLAIAMRYDIDAVDILNKKRYIFLPDRDKQLAKVRPVISRVFDDYLKNRKEGDGTGAGAGAGAGSNKKRGNMKRERKSSNSSKKSSISVEKDYRKNFGKNFKSSSPSSSNTPSKSKKKSQLKNKMYTKPKKMASSSESSKRKKLILPKVKKSKDSSLSNVSRSRSRNKKIPEIRKKISHSKSNSKPNLKPVASKEQMKEPKNTILEKTVPSNMNLEKEEKAILQDPHTTVNYPNKKVIDLSHITKTGYSNECVCFVLGVPLEYNENEIIWSITNLNELIRNKITNVDDVRKHLIDNPVKMEWKSENDIDYLKMIFSNKDSVENLIMSNFKIQNNPVIVLPFIQDKEFKELLVYHQMKLTCSTKIDFNILMNIYFYFSTYGEIVDIVTTNDNNAVIIYSKHLQKFNKYPFPPSIQFTIGSEIIKNDIRPIENNEVYPVKRKSLFETTPARVYFYQMQLNNANPPPQTISQIPQIIPIPQKVVPPPATLNNNPVNKQINESQTKERDKEIDDQQIRSSARLKLPNKASRKSSSSKKHTSNEKETKKYKKGRSSSFSDDDYYHKKQQKKYKTFDNYGGNMGGQYNRNYNRRQHGQHGNKGYYNNNYRKQQNNNNNNNRRYR